MKILTYHVVSGKVLSSDLTESDVPTVQGSDVKVTVDPPAINGANVVLADVLATNGVVHVIDAVRICVEINQCVGCSLTHFSAMTWPCWLHRAVKKRGEI